VGVFLRFEENAEGGKIEKNDFRVGSMWLVFPWSTVGKKEK
jgi:hypothetical protein